MSVYRLAPGRQPFTLWALLALLLFAQTGFTQRLTHQARQQSSPGAAPSAQLSLIAGMGERAAVGYAMNLYVQSFDAQAGAVLKMREFDHPAIAQWLERAAQVNPSSSYSLMLASRVFAEIASDANSRVFLDLVHRHFTARPNERWVWLSHAIFVARHFLQDPELARHYSRSLRELTDPAQVPRWARQMEVFLLVEQNQAQAAQLLIAAMLASGQIADQQELELLTQRLSEGGSQGDRRSQEKTLTSR